MGKPEEISGEQTDAQAEEQVLEQTEAQAEEQVLEQTEALTAEQPGEQNEKKRRRLRAIGLGSILLLILGGLFGTLFGIYRHYERFYETHFYEGTVINGMDVSFQTVEDVKRQIEEGISAYEIRVEEKDGKSEVLRAADLGWHYADDQKVDQLMAGQDPRHWFARRAEARSFEVAAGTDYDREKAKEAIGRLQALSGDGIISPKDAYLTETEDGSYAVIPETEGNRLDADQTEKTILAALDRSAAEVSLLEPDCYLHPEIFSDDENLCTRRDEWNRLLGIRIAYAFGDNEEVIDASFLKDYMSDDGEHVSLSTDWVKDLVYGWGSKYDTFGLARSFTTHDGKTVSIPAGGDYGWCLNKEETIRDLTQAVEQAESGTREPVWLYRAKGWSNGDITGTYVEVSLSKQHLWCYKDGELVQETDVVTGAPTKERKTLKGIYAIDAKKSPAVLGRLDVQGYASPVSFWCPFNGGQGLHDAPWRNAFGKNVYKSNGSHGCVNIPPDKMEKIYNTVEIGTAVIVY